ELLSLLQFPFGPRLIREIRRRDQPGSCEIQDEWARDDTHLDDAQLVVETNELRDIESQNLTHARVPQPFVHLALTEIRLDGTMYCEGRFTGLGLVFSHEDDTVNSETQPLGELKLMLRRKGLSVLDQNFFHGGAIESGRALSPSENEAAGRRRFHSRGTVGAGFSSGERSVRPSSRRCQRGLGSGPKRTPLERESAAWHIRRLQTCGHRREGVTAKLRAFHLFSEDRIRQLSVHEVDVTTGGIRRQRFRCHS